MASLWHEDKPQPELETESYKRRPITLLYADWIPQDRFFVLAFRCLVSCVDSAGVQQNGCKRESRVA